MSTHKTIKPFSIILSPVTPLVNVAAEWSRQRSLRSNTQIHSKKATVMVKISGSGVHSVFFHTLNKKHRNYFPNQVRRLSNRWTQQIYNEGATCCPYLQGDHHCWYKKRSSEKKELKQNEIRKGTSIQDIK